MLSKTSISKLYPKVEPSCLKAEALRRSWRRRQRGAGDEGAAEQDDSRSHEKKVISFLSSCVSIPSADQGTLPGLKEGSVSGKS